MTVLRGIELRYVLSMQLARHGRATIRELVDALARHGFTADAPANKSVSDALRWECRRGRVRHIRRGVYGPGEMPRGTEHRIRQRELALRAEAIRSEAGKPTPAPGRAEPSGMRDTG
ncbi:hypothetical protein [Mycobacterium sp.]|uniref:hypothetical protein n=1 Tax=Mycobacterium sp. TaxID=1785 RepID=UPI0025CE6456|nr:hypothetical protein [Mycobacterium sp.]